MCRIAGFIGARPLALRALITDPPHGLGHQAWAAREMVSATVNADGWGAAWLDESGRPAGYRQILPIWADINLASLGRSLQSPLWLANVRSATAGLGTDYANTQPFYSDDWLFTHNGFIDDFARTLRSQLRADIAPEIETTINGNTDSEYLFALMRQQTGTLSERLRAVIGLIRTWLADAPEVRALLNMIASDGQQMVAVRAAVNGDAPSLYFSADWHGGTAIGSEAFDDQPGWTEVASGELIIAEAGQPPRRESL
ncbi:class II glutamine amidotransferase [uncultured Salinisphaera sp.]|uniref:class II glutamine amidotransferase n=1 Tax=uncultured Salinisphaera sp. TaxID=359372 RepID=UPI0032B10110